MPCRSSREHKECEVTSLLNRKGGILLMDERTSLDDDPTWVAIEGSTGFLGSSNGTDGPEIKKGAIETPNHDL